MEYSTSQELKEAWDKKPCIHPHLEKVFYNGAFLINYSCTTCGEDFTIAQKMEIDEEKRAVNTIP